MRYLAAGFAILFLISCGDNDESQARVDSTAETEYTNSSSFLGGDKSVIMRCAVPVLVDTLADRYSSSRIDNRIAADLLPPDFDYENYKEVSCIAKTEIGVIPVLFVKLVSEPEYDESPPAVDILMVLYDCNYQPIDVYNVQSSGLGYSRSYVRSDSVFTISVDEMENINVATTAIAITEKGFIVGSSETRTFDPGKEGYQESTEYKNAYFMSKGVTIVQ